MLSKIGLFHPSARLETKILFEKKRERKKERKQEGKKRMVKTSLFGKTFHLELQRSCTSDKREKENKCTDRPKKKKSKKAPVSWRSKVTRKKKQAGKFKRRKKCFNTVSPETLARDIRDMGRYLRHMPHSIYPISVTHSGCNSSRKGI